MSIERSDNIYTQCLNENCKKKDLCKRYKRENGAIINFKPICEDNRKIPYKWFWEKKANIVKKEDEENI